MIKKSGQKIKYLDTERGFKAICNIFKRLSVSKSCLDPESPPLGYFPLIIPGLVPNYILNASGKLDIEYLKSIICKTRNIESEVSQTATISTSKCTNNWQSILLKEINTVY